MKQRKIGLALGSGAAKGWAHIGVIQALTEMGIVVDVGAGCSVGALVWAAYATHRLNAMARWVSGFHHWDVVRLMDLSWQRGGRVFNQVRHILRTQQIDECAIKFGAVATNLTTARELWLTEGDLHHAIRASCSMPGLLAPVRHNAYWLVDGAVVNSVPVSLARAPGADVVIAVDLQHNATLGHDDMLSVAAMAEETHADSTLLNWQHKLRRRLTMGLQRQRANRAPSAIDIMTASIQVLENRLKMHRMAGDPPDVVVQPYCPQIATLDFHRAQEAIAAGRLAVEKKQDELQLLVDRDAG